jgi:hypothetical protein
MADADPGKLAKQLEDEAGRLERQSSEVQDRIEEAREDWQRKRADPGVPGAVAPEPESDSDEEITDTSPAPQAPPEEEGPSAAEMAPEGAVGPPKDQIDDS